MGLSECKAMVDDRGRELVEHGTSAFPIACYHDDLETLEVPWHWHEEWEAVLVHQGSALVKAGGEQAVIHAGDGFFINSGVVHGCWNTGKEPCRFHSLVFHPRLVGGSPDSVFYQRYVFPLQRCSRMGMIHLHADVPWQHRALEAIETAWQAGVQEEDGYEWKVRSALSELTAELCGRVPAEAAAPSSKMLRDGERIKRMLSYIEEHLGEPLSTETIARSAALSQSECLRCFRAVIGAAPIQYVRRLRIQRACHMLETTGEKISDIAVWCGFQDMSYFAKTFRETMGCTPTAFRQKKQSTRGI